MQTFAANVVLWMGLSLGIGASAAVAATPPPNSPLARLEAEQLDRLPPVAPWGTASIDHSGGIRRAMRPTTRRNSRTGRWLAAIT